MPSKNSIAAERVRKLLHYEPETGLLTWLVSTSNRVKVGAVAGSDNGDGQIRIHIDGHRYVAHAIIWLLVTGDWPSPMVDHRDLDRSNNRWVNLRKATKAQNGANRPMQANNKTGYKGVHWYKNYGCYRACIGIGGVTKHLGYFDDPAEANAAYAHAAREAFGEFSRA